VVAFLEAPVIEELVALNATAEEHFRAGRYEAFLRQNREFHQTLAAATRNRLLQQMLGAIHDRVRQVGTLLVELHQPRLKELLLENRRIVAAIRKKDRHALEKAVRHHIQRGRDHVMRLLATASDNDRPFFISTITR